jgi:hypothetical protein
MKTMRLQTMGVQIRQRDYGVGDIIKPKCGTCFDHCGVLVGWDSWLRPLVFSISRKPSVLHFQMVSLDEFEAGEGSEIVHPAPQGNLMPQARGGTSTDMIWTRIQQVLRGGASRRVGSWNCEAIARFVVTGEALSQPIGDRDSQMVA